MVVSRGKDFEKIIYKGLTELDDVSVDRIYDNMGGFYGVTNICDFIVYKYPAIYYLELKAIRGNCLNFKSQITEVQWKGLLEKSPIKGVTAGILVWFIEHDITAFIPIDYLEHLKNNGLKSFAIGMFDFKTQIYKCGVTVLKGKKKRVFFDYDLKDFLERMV